MFKRIIVLAALIVIFSINVAYAGFGVHKNLDGSDSCSSCHSDHAPVGETWKSHETIEYQFCTTCHGVAATGADTDVVSGIYDNPGSVNGTYGKALNSGGFEEVGGLSAGATTSTHSVAGENLSIFGNSTGASVALTCTSCHDPDGSSNYRLLKDIVNGVDVSNYVESNEPGFGDSLSEDPNIYNNYKPNYTQANYKKPTDLTKGISGWCSACHDNYRSDSYEIDPKTGKKRYYYIDSKGKRRYHHSINVANGKNPDGNKSPDLPLAKDSASTPNNDPNNIVVCLTCHRAHGTNATMTNIATTNQVGSALLRLNNRGVCQNCHKK